MNKMNKNNKPDYKGNGVAVWKNIAPATGKEYLTISLFHGQIKIAAFKDYNTVHKVKESQLETPKTTEERIE